MRSQALCIIITEVLGMVKVEISAEFLEEVLGRLVEAGKIWVSAEEGELRIDLRAFPFVGAHLRVLLEKPQVSSHDFAVFRVDGGPLWDMFGESVERFVNDEVKNLPFLEASLRGGKLSVRIRPPVLLIAGFNADSGKVSFHLKPCERR